MAEPTKAEKRRLRRYVCRWCGMPFHRNSCGAFYERCSPETMAKRRADCLAQYKPRKRQANVNPR